MKNRFSLFAAILAVITFSSGAFAQLTIDDQQDPPLHSQPDEGDEVMVSPADTVKAVPVEKPASPPQAEESVPPPPPLNEAAERSRIFADRDRECVEARHAHYSSIRTLSQAQAVRPRLEAKLHAIQRRCDERLAALEKRVALVEHTLRHTADAVRSFRTSASEKIATLTVRQGTAELDIKALRNDVDALKQIQQPNRNRTLEKVAEAPTPRPGVKASKQPTASQPTNPILIFLQDWRPWVYALAVIIAVLGIVKLVQRIWGPPAPVGR